MEAVLKWVFDLVTNGSEAVKIVTTPFLDLGTGVTYTMLSLLTFGGLAVYLGIALVKWLAS